MEPFITKRQFDRQACILMTRELHDTFSFILEVPES